MFIDETEITVSSGRGGDGIVSFRREKFVPRGGPDGGDGGRGGDVVLRSSVHLNTLAGLQHRRHYRGGNGQPGGANNRTGRDGESLLIEVPVGTLVRDRERGHVLRDLSEAGVEFVVVAGGRGGKGNKHFAHSTNQTPRRATEGQPGQARELQLELRLVADVGLVGLPNAGKSTFLSRVSAARPKVADYPFTTLEPVLGIVHRDQFGMVVADIPGLIEGAHEGAGLGDRFLRHVARTRVLLQLVDASEGAEAAITAYRTVRSELALSGLALEEKAVVVALSRSDTVENPGAIARALEAASGVPVAVLSAHTGLGVADVLGRLARLLEDVPRPQLPAREPIGARAGHLPGDVAADPAAGADRTPADEPIDAAPAPKRAAGSDVLAPVAGAQAFAGKGETHATGTAAPFVGAPLGTVARSGELTLGTARPADGQAAAADASRTLSAVRADKKPKSPGASKRGAKHGLRQATTVRKPRRGSRSGKPAAKRVAKQAASAASRTGTQAVARSGAKPAAKVAARQGRAAHHGSGSSQQAKVGAKGRQKVPAKVGTTAGARVGKQSGTKAGTRRMAKRITRESASPAVKSGRKAASTRSAALRAKGVAKPAAKRVGKAATPAARSRTRR